ncbi:MAG: hypothetical protein K2N69_01425 [Helicobacter sp.]|nr:hypothetical protein [Helicobacter sp.]
MSNGESKIAIFKAALCCGFAIALRTLFLGILCRSIASLTLAMTHPLPPEHREGEMEAGFSRTHCVIASEHSERGNQRARNPDTVDCHEASASRNDTRTRHCSEARAQQATISSIQRR